MNVPQACEHAVGRAVHGTRDPDVPVDVPDRGHPGRCRRVDPDAQSGAATAAETWIDLAITGAALGSVYALIALGYTMVYGILRMINFAHGEIFMAGTFAGYFTAVGLAGRGILNAGPLAGLLSVAIMCAVAAVVATAIALLVERIAYRPLRNASAARAADLRDRGVVRAPVLVPGLLRPGIYATRRSTSSRATSPSRSSTSSGSRSW